MAEAQINLYELNQENYAKIEPLDSIWLNRKFAKIEEAMTGRYWMLLCHENRDYTIFNLSYSEKTGSIAKDLKETLFNRGLIVDIEDKENGAYEIWVRNSEKTEAHAYYLFNYDEGVIECE